MADPSVTITAIDGGGVAYTITLLATSSTTADLTLSPAGSSNNETHALSNIQRRGNQVTCQTPVVFWMATIAVTVEAEAFEIGWAASPPETYTISAADGAALLAWLQNFPESTTMVFPYKYGRSPPMSFPFKFGRRRMVAPKTCMRFRDYQQLSFPEAPAAGDYRPNAATALAQMYGNDQLGDCVIAWMAHAIGVFTGNATGTPVIFSQADIIKEYGAIGGYDPSDPSTDQGCDENTALDYWVSTGFIAPEHKISGFLSIDATNPKECAAAVWLFENLMFGVALPDEWTHPIAAGSGFTWDVAGDPDPDQNHCFGAVSWDEHGVGVETWGMDGKITYAAMAKYAVASAGGQLFTVITPEIINRATMRAPSGFDWNQLTTDFVGMGGTVSIPTPPATQLIGKKAS